jgi:DNA-binding NarL/FixJ family response regulator
MDKTAKNDTAAKADGIITILIADDHPVVRRGLKATVEEEESFRVVAEAADGNEALALLAATHPEVAVIDIDMPGKNGLAVAREARSQQLDTKIIFMTFHADEELVRATMEVGGQGYLLKNSAMEEIVSAVHSVVAGRTYLCSAMADIMLRQKTEAEKTPFYDINQLTPAEKRIVRLIAEGKSSKEIGDELSIHYRTVENHRTNVCRKLGLEGANALVRFALQQRTALQERLY